jgi:hypothetical protein
MPAGPPSPQSRRHRPAASDSGTHPKQDSRSNLRRGIADCGFASLPAGAIPRGLQ